MNIIEKPINEVIPYEKNPRIWFSEDRIISGSMSRAYTDGKAERHTIGIAIESRRRSLI